jgi:8-oxo-dGTP pyrophosphatase MutT (NUDIX family)
MSRDDTDEREIEMAGMAVAPRGNPDPTQSPWRTLRAREVYRNPWIAVTEYAVLRPDGKEGIYGVVEPGDNAAVVALDVDGRVYLVGEFVYPVQTFEWTIPSGKVEDSEETLVAARRELAEEVGLSANSWASLGSYLLTSGISPQVSHVFLATGLTAGAPQPEGTERLTIRAVPLAEAVEMCLRSEIRDAPSVLGIWRAWFQLRGE